MNAMENTIHGCAVVCNNRGLLIIGPSGSGKSTLVHALIERSCDMSMFACWVGDDRIQVRNLGSDYVAAPASPIAGQTERYFGGIENAVHLPSARLDLVVELVSTNALERMPASITHKNYPSLPLLKVPEKQISISIPLIFSQLTRL